MKLIVVTGMPGAGKSEVADYLQRRYGIPVVVMGDVIREEARRRGLEPDSANTKSIMLELRERDGPSAIAIRCVGKLKEMDNPIVVIEGCRSLAEVDVFRKFAEHAVIVCVHSSPATRFERLRSRGREDAPSSYEVFKERDMREISVGLGGVIALADIMLVNEGTLSQLRGMIHEIAEVLIENAR